MPFMVESWRAGKTAQYFEKDLGGALDCMMNELARGGDVDVGVWLGDDLVASGIVFGGEETVRYYGVA